MKDLWTLESVYNKKLQYTNYDQSNYVYWIDIKVLNTKKIEITFREHNYIKPTEENHNKSKFFFSTLEKKGFKNLSSKSMLPTFELSTSEECKMFIEALQELENLDNIQTEIFDSFDFKKIEEKIIQKQNEYDNSEKGTRDKLKTDFFKAKHDNNNNNAGFTMPYMKMEINNISLATDAQQTKLVELDSMFDLGRIILHERGLLVMFPNVDQAKEFNKLLFASGFTNPQDKGQQKKFQLNPNQTEFGVLLSEDEYNKIKQNPNAYIELVSLGQDIAISQINL